MMRAISYLWVASVFVTVALLTYAIIRAIGWNAHDFALVAAAIVASQVGTFVWYRQAPESAERSVKLGLGAVLSVTAVAFSLIFQAVGAWLTSPEVTIPIMAVGCFAFPFATVGPVWKALSNGRPPENKDT
jgi:hypothetical protein